MTRVIRAGLTVGATVVAVLAGAVLVARPVVRSPAVARRTKRDPTGPIHVPPPVPATAEAMQRAIDTMSASGGPFAEVDS